jgi:Xaa-Pro aminopeptidase
LARLQVGARSSVAVVVGTTDGRRARPELHLPGVHPVIVTVDPADLHRRRTALARALLGQPALIAAGSPPPRNYPANTYRFRASSHFLYLVGSPIRDAFLLIDGIRSTLYVPEASAYDALWHGPRPGFDDLAECTACDVRPLSELASALTAAARAAPSGVATLPAVDLASCLVQSALLGRDIRPGVLASQDEPLADAIIALRLRHDDAALRSLRAASAITSRAHHAGMAATAPGVRENQICAAMEYEIARGGGVPAYGSIVTVHGEVLHNESHDGVCAEGDLLLADVGAESADGWAADVTRTWPVSGRYSPTQRAIYDVVLAANLAAIDAVRPGVRFRDVHLTAARQLASGLVDLGILRGEPDDLVERGVHALFFPHGVGHLLGLDVHDMEDLGDRVGYAPGRQRSGQFGLSYLRLDRDLEPGMVVTIEPGFYVVPAIFAMPELGALAREHVDFARLAQFSDVRGVRIEDDVLVTPGGHEVLTRHIPKAAEDIETLLVHREKGDSR